MFCSFCLSKMVTTQRPCVVYFKMLFRHGRGLRDEMLFWVHTVDVSETFA